jgi:3-phenylpropionate/trans-cinnamate dioxygenase ferredoxin subunit
MAVSEWIAAAHVEDVPPGEGFQVDINGALVAIWNIGGEFYATSDICSHEETPLTAGDLWDNVIECPLHGAQFDVTTGEVLSLPAIFPIPTYPVKVQDGTIYVGWRVDEG